MFSSPHAGLDPARWDVFKALDRVGGGTCEQLVLGCPASFPLTWPWAPCPLCRMWTPTIPFGVQEHLQQLDARISLR